MLVQGIDHLEISVRDRFASGRRGKFEGATGPGRTAGMNDIGLILRPGDKEEKAIIVYNKNIISWQLADGVLANY